MIIDTFYSLYATTTPNRHFVIQILDINTTNNVGITGKQNYIVEIKPLFEVGFVWITADSGWIRFHDALATYNELGRYYSRTTENVAFSRNNNTDNLFALPYIRNREPQFLNIKRNYINNFGFGGVLANEQNANPEHNDFIENSYIPNQDFGHYFWGSDLNFTSYSINELNNPVARPVDSVSTIGGAISTVAGLFPVPGMILATTTWSVIDLARTLIKSSGNLPPVAQLNQSSAYLQYNRITHSEQTDPPSMGGYGYLMKNCATLPVNDDLALSLHGTEPSYARGILKIAQERGPHPNYWISRFDATFSFDICRYDSNDDFKQTANWKKRETLGNIHENYKEIAPKINGQGEFSYNLDQSFTLYNYYNNTSYLKFTLPNGRYRINIDSNLYTIQFSGNVKPINYSFNTYYFNGDTEYYLEIKYSKDNISIGSFTIDVIEIGDSAFAGQTDLKTIDIPNTVTTIGNNAFANSMCNEVVIPSSVSFIGLNAFRYCSNLTQITVNTNNQNYSSQDGILFDKAGQVLIKYPEGKTAGQTYTIPSQVRRIEAYALASTALNEIVIHSNVSDIREGVFAETNSLSRITVNAANTYYSSCQAGILYNKAKTSLIHAPQAVSGEVVIPSTIRAIDNKAFYNRSWMTKITIPSSVNSIGFEAFRGCSRLNEIIIPFVGGGLNNVLATSNTHFGYIFGAVDFTEHTHVPPWPITIPASLKKVTVTGDGKIQDYAFLGCTNLTSIIIQGNMTGIGMLAFAACDNLVSIILPDSITSLGNNVFFDCAKLASIVLPSGLTSIGKLSFNNCTSLKNIEISSGVQSIGDMAFRNSGLTSIIIPASVTAIGIEAFKGCTALTGVVFEDNGGLTQIGDNAFQGCTGLTDIVLPSNLYSIGTSAFENCTGLASIIIKSNVTSVAANVFNNCVKLTIYIARINANGWDSSWNSSRRPVIFNVALSDAEIMCIRL